MNLGVHTLYFGGQRDGVDSTDAKLLEVAIFEHELQLLGRDVAEIRVIAEFIDHEPRPRQNWSDKLLETCVSGIFATEHP